MEIQSTDAEGTYGVYIDPPRETQPWEKIGKVAFYSCSFVAAGAFIPALLKKNRTYSFVPAHPAQAIQPPVEEVVVDVAGEPAPIPRCTPEEKGKIEDIFGTVADGGANLIWEGFRLRRLGDEIDHVHPFALLLAMPKEKIRQIFMSGVGFKIGSITSGIDKGMQRELARNNVNRFIPGFAAETRKQEERIRQLIQAADWNGFVRYLFGIQA